jgi:hypothetical protein
MAAAQQSFEPVTTPQPIVIDSKKGTVVFLDENWNVVLPGNATMAKVIFDNGDRAFYVVTSDA